MQGIWPPSKAPAIGKIKRIHTSELAYNKASTPPRFLQQSRAEEKNVRFGELNTESSSFGTWVGTALGGGGVGTVMSTIFDVIRPWLHT